MVRAVCLAFFVSLSNGCPWQWSQLTPSEALMKNMALFNWLSGTSLRTCTFFMASPAVLSANGATAAEGLAAGDCPDTAQKELEITNPTAASRMRNCVFIAKSFRQVVTCCGTPEK